MGIAPCRGTDLFMAVPVPTYSNECELVSIRLILCRVKGSSGNISEWCKSEESFNYLIDTKFQFNKKIIEFEKTKSNIKKYYSKKDSENIKICKELTIEEWNELWAWCRETNKVDTELSNLCLSFLNMAEKKWVSDPSPKQAEKIIVAINLAEENGVI